MPLADSSPSAGTPSTAAASRPRSTRDRPAKSPLSGQAILQSEGLGAVTMRRVARALDTGASSLYVYVPNREGLLSLMLDRVLATIELESPDPSRWRAQLHSLLRRMHRALIAHPGIAAITLADPATTETMLSVVENLLGILLAGGLDAQDAAWACDTVVLLVTGAAHEEEMRRFNPDSPQQQIDELYDLFTRLPDDRFPLLSTHAREMLAGDGDERFRFAVDLVVDGLVARAARRGADPEASPS
jgi:AcrR family transcriptional regulator